MSQRRFIVPRAEAGRALGDWLRGRLSLPATAVRDLLKRRRVRLDGALCFDAARRLRPGQRVVELCCGRGNKTLQIASRMRDTGTVLAVDDDAKKIAQTQARLDAADIASVALVTADVTQMQAAPDADAVLLDAPCSGLGILGRQPEARWRKNPDDPQRMQAVQKQLLDAAAQSVKPGGALVYAVCSTDAREGEGVVDPFLAAHPAFTRDALPERYAPLRTAAGDVLVAPGIDGRDGFYVARLRRG